MRDVQSALDRSLATNWVEPSGEFAFIYNNTVGDSVVRVRLVLPPDARVKLLSSPISYRRELIKVKWERGTLAEGRLNEESNG